MSESLTVEEAVWAPMPFAGATRLFSMRVEVMGEELNDIWRGKLIGRTIQLCFWCVSSAAIPQTAEDRVAWLDAQWERIDAWISVHASRTGARHAGFEDDSHRARAAASSRDE